MTSPTPPRRGPTSGPSLTPGERSLRARLASYESWKVTGDPAARTAPARSAFLSRFDREVDPEGTLPDAERHRRADAARKAYFTRLAYASSRARSAKKRPS